MAYHKTTVDLDRDLLDRFKEHYPQRGSIKWFFNDVLRIFNELHTYESDEVIREAIQATLNEDAPT